MSAAEVEAVLSGRVHYDQAAPVVQTAVRHAWERAVDGAVGNLDFAAEFGALGRTWVELVDGVVVQRPAGRG